MTVIEKGDFLLNRLEKWYDDNNSYKVRYEELLSHAALELQNVLRFCNLTAAPGRINKVISANSFNRKSGRDRGFEDNKSFYRKGIAGDWRNRFDEECSERFKTSKDGRWNTLLLEMGYENKLDWKI